MTQEQLYQQQQAQKALGDQGEDFALRFERQRLYAHPRSSDVRLIGRSDVATGYDILSFMGTTSSRHDRYIEVKTYSGEPHFFLSASEQSAATRYGNNYFVYLVDKARINDPGYAPHIIQNPASTLLQNEQWQEKIQTREFTYVDTQQQQLPDDLDASTVLIGCFRTNEQLNWIRHNHAYNVRSSIINGAVRKDEVTSAVKYLLLYFVREPRTYSIYKVSGIRYADRAYMLRTGYPDPHANEYLLYELTKKIELPLIDIMQIVRTYNDILQRTSGTPIYLSGRDLKQYMPSAPHNPGTAPRRLYTNEGKPWHTADKALLKALYLSATPIDALAHRLHRTAEEIKSQLQAQGLLPAS